MRRRKKFGKIVFQVAQHVGGSPRSRFAKSGEEWQRRDCLAGGFWRLQLSLWNRAKASKNMNEGGLLADMFLPSHWESQTRHQVASRTSETMHTARASCLARTLGRWASKPNMKINNEWENKSASHILGTLLFLIFLIFRAKQRNQWSLASQWLLDLSDPRLSTFTVEHCHDLNIGSANLAQQWTQHYFLECFRKRNLVVIM